MRVAVVAGLLVGSLLVVAVAVSDDTRSPAPPAAPAFLAAWRHSLTGTYVLEERIDRRLVDGRRITTEARLAQRPPDRVRVSGGRVEGWRDGRRLACAAGPGAEVACTDGGPAPAYASVVRDEMDGLRALVASTQPAYAVARDGHGCFVLRLRARVLAPPYGEDATFCFDPATGAPRSSVVHRAESTDEHRAIRLTGTVRDVDLEPTTGG